MDLCYLLVFLTAVSLVQISAGLDDGVRGPE